ncbi:MAG: bifunctional DNA-formamidopyrimidine glycosylase/DNA-(apurinic or apyrimidinic site) lyase [Candidatus Aenigmarchaeota archaeon]|nr:bifunctional DNA-formamidopyrimidine glycosylase/DNA-(apurinic or apyrimidinic site) lyase [Candidatus Aenigmarchaeota archaeon]
MPELPEVETVRLGLGHLPGRLVKGIVVRQEQLRWPVPKEVTSLKGQRITKLERRAKYLLLQADNGTAIIHLGMAGRLQFLSEAKPAGKHDHFDIILEHGCLRFTDPRRFGSLLWTAGRPEQHPLLRDLGPEPLGKGFSSDYLFQKSRKRSLAAKSFIMDSKIVAGVGNIYASESLFQAGIRPSRPAGRLTRAECKRLVAAVRSVLANAIQQGGTTLRDYRQSDGQPGYFQQKLFVYGRGGQACRNCRGKIRSVRTGQRSTFYCPNCQK